MATTGGCCIYLGKLMLPEFLWKTAGGTVFDTKKQSSQALESSANFVYREKIKKTQRYKLIMLSGSLITL